MKSQTKRTSFYDWEQVGELQKYEDVLRFEDKQWIKTNTYCCSSKAKSKYYKCLYYYQNPLKGTK